MGKSGEECCLFYFRCIRWKYPFTQMWIWFLFPFLLLLVWSSLSCSLHTAATCCLCGSDGGFSSCGCQFVKQEQVLRGQGASLKDSHYSHLPEMHRCTCFFRYAHHCSSNFFVLSADMFYPQSPGAVSDFEWQQVSAQRIWKENRLETLQSSNGQDAEILRSWTHLGGVILHVFPETNVHKTLHHLSPQSSGDWQKRIQLLSSCVCMRSPDKWQQKPSQVSCCPNVKVTLTDTTHPVLFRILQYASAYLCWGFFYLYYIESLHLFAWSLHTHPLNDGLF